MSLSTYTLSPKQTFDRLEVSIKANIPCMVTSSPGLGKSSIVKALADKYELELIDIRLAQVQAFDLN